MHLGDATFCASFHANFLRPPHQCLRPLHCGLLSQRALPQADTPARSRYRPRGPQRLTHASLRQRVRMRRETVACASLAALLVIGVLRLPGLQQAVLDLGSPKGHSSRRHAVRIEAPPFNKGLWERTLAKDHAPGPSHTHTHLPWNCSRAATPPSLLTTHQIWRALEIHPEELPLMSVKHVPTSVNLQQYCFFRAGVPDPTQRSDRSFGRAQSP